MSALVFAFTHFLLVYFQRYLKRQEDVENNVRHGLNENGTKKNKFSKRGRVAGQCNIECRKNNEITQFDFSKLDKLKLNEFGKTVNGLRGVINKDRKRARITFSNRKFWRTLIDNGRRDMVRTETETHHPKMQSLYFAFILQGYRK